MFTMLAQQWGHRSEWDQIHTFDSLIDFTFFFFFYVRILLSATIFLNLYGRKKHFDAKKPMHTTPYFIIQIVIDLLVKEMLRSPTHLLIPITFTHFQ